MIKECNSIQEYNEACKEYYKYHYNRFSCSESEHNIKDLIVGISFKITTPEQFKDNDIRKIFSSNVSILDDSLPLLNRYCCFTCDKTSEGIYIGIEATEEDFYYMLKTSNGEILYESCVGGIEDKFPNIEY